MDEETVLPGEVSTDPVSESTTAPDETEATEETGSLVTVEVFCAVFSDIIHNLVRGLFDFKEDNDG